jgi:hypothetical protein
MDDVAEFLVFAQKTFIEIRDSGLDRNGRPRRETQSETVRWLLNGPHVELTVVNPLAGSEVGVSRRTYRGRWEEAKLESDEWESLEFKMTFRGRYPSSELASELSEMHRERDEQQVAEDDHNEPPFWRLPDKEFDYEISLGVDRRTKTSSVSLGLPDDAMGAAFRAKMLAILERSRAATRRESPRIFIGHGGNSELWRIVESALVDRGFPVEAFETKSRAGLGIQNILKDVLSASNFAVLVFTAEDEQSDGSMRARQNVIHETGLFQGRHGFEHVALLLEQGVESFSNLDGYQYISFPRGRISSAIPQIIEMLSREFPMPDDSPLLIT